MSSKLSTLLRNRTVMRTTFDNLTVEELFQLKHKDNQEVTDAVNYYIKENSLVIHEGSVTFFKTSYVYSYDENEETRSQRRGIGKTTNISNYLVFVFPSSYKQSSKGYSDYDLPLYIITPDLESFKRYEIDIDYFNKKIKENNSISYKYINHRDSKDDYPNLKISLTDKFFIFDFNKSEVLNIYFTCLNNTGARNFFALLEEKMII